MRLGVDHHHVTGGHHLPDIILGVLLPIAAFQANLGLQVGFTTSCLTSSLPPWYGLSLFSPHGHREHGQGPALPCPGAPSSPVHALLNPGTAVPEAEVICSVPCTELLHQTPCFGRLCFISGPDCVPAMEENQI